MINNFQYGNEPTEDEIQAVYDVCVIGSGASGGVAVSTFVKAGLSTLCIEQGPFVDHTTSYEQILDSAEPAFVRPGFSVNWQPLGYAYSTSNVGGGTVFYGGASFRYREVDFKAQMHFPDSTIPIDWPFEYQVLDPYYTRMEQLLRVAGNNRMDPTIPPHSNILCSEHNPSVQGSIIKDTAVKMGLKPFPTPLSLLSQTHESRSTCTENHTCICNQCNNAGKSDVFTVFLKPILKDKNFKLLAGIKALQLECENEDVKSVACVHVQSNKSYRFKAKKFVLALNAIQTAALLLRSDHNGSTCAVGNEYDMVGRGLCFKMSRYSAGLLHDFFSSSSRDKKGLNQRGPFSTVTITDYYKSNDCPSGLGGMIYESRHENSVVHQVNNELHLRIEGMLADQPCRENRVRLMNKKDLFGFGAIGWAYSAHPRDLFRLEFLTDRCQEILRQAGCKTILNEESNWQFGSTHLHGTCRSGLDPKTSVTDSNGKIHTVNNTYVVDGSFMPYPGSVNPTLTIQANALRIAEHIAKLN